jgi:hypothetical protein
LDVKEQVRKKDLLMVQCLVVVDVVVVGLVPVAAQENPVVQSVLLALLAKNLI